MMCKSVCWFPHRKSCQNENLSDWFLVASRSMPLIFIHLLLWISKLPTPSLSDLWTCQESSCVPSGNFTHGNWAFLIDDYLWKKIVLFHRYVKNIPKGRTCSRNSQWWSDSCFLCFFWLSCSSMAADSPSSGEKLRDDMRSMCETEAVHICETVRCVYESDGIQRFKLGPADVLPACHQVLRG